ncbi:MAG TPA: condensin subunit MukF [Polyangiaceae bacterium]|nr:condensin subunit MukF [Polyangiaceae bacterium]
MSSPAAPEPNQALLALAERNVRLELETLDICFLAALYLRAERAQLSAFDEAQLFEVFEQVALVLDPSAGNAQKRAGAALRRAREQRLLARVDGAGLSRAGEYALTRLSLGIVEFFLQDESLTRESLTVLTRTLLASLTEVARVAADLNESSDFQALVVAPLSITVQELLSGIERRQRGFDLEQERLKREIGELVRADWFGAVERCQTLLDTTSQTLGELNQVLLRDTHAIMTLLQDIDEAAARAGRDEADRTLRAIMDQIDRIAAWGSARQRAWSEYYQYVHRYLRDVVRLDPSRTLIQRLREQLSGKGGRRYALCVAAAAPARVLREVLPPIERPPVRRKKKPVEAAAETVEASDPDADLQARVVIALGEGKRSLAEITAQLTEDETPSQRFLAAGKIAETVARVAQPREVSERPWVSVGGGVSIEDWPELDP